MDAMTEVVSAVVESVVREDANPIPPPRRKRKVLRLQSLSSETSTCENKPDSPGAELETESISPSSGILISQSSTSEAEQRLRGSTTSVCSSDICESSTGLDKDSVTSVRDSAERLTLSLSSSRVENYYSGSAMRRKSVPSNSAIDKPSPAARSDSLSPAGLEREKSATPSSSDAPVENQSPTKTKPPPRPSTVPSRPPRSPSFGTGGVNKAASTNTSAAKDTIVIDSTCSNDKPKSSVTSPYGRIGGTQRRHSKKDRNKDDASKAYGKRTQAALNTLVATVKMFNRGTSSGSSGQKTTSVTRKMIKSKTPPKRPPPAVRNTPRPPLPKTEDDSEDSLYVNQYEDHIYMEVSMALKERRTASMQCQSESGLKDPEGEGEEDAYVIMNPVNSSHIYTSLDIKTKNETKEYDVIPVVARSTKRSTTAVMETSKLLDKDDNMYISPEELKRHNVVTSLGSDTEHKCGTPTADQNYENMSYDDAKCETTNYENVTAIMAEKQRNFELSPSLQQEVTRRTLPH